MRRIALLLLAASSLLPAANAATRPRYGGTLHVASREAPASLDPANPPSTPARANILRLLFENLATLDPPGHPQPQLATSWDADPGNQRWRILLRRDVTFSDGTPLTPDIAAASLRVANPNWKVQAIGEALMIESDTPVLDLPAQLASPRYAIAKRANGKLLGTGPYAIAQWDPGKKLTLAARDDYWAGRPYLDSIEIELSKNLREQMISLDLGKADLIEVAPEQARRAGDNRRIESSLPIELMTMVFDRDRQSSDDGHLRIALSLSIDRGSLSTVLLQGGGEPAGGLLPSWMTGYAFLFPSALDLAHAKQERGEARSALAWTLAYDAADPLTRVAAERIALNARDAGLSIQLVGTTAADLRLVRVSLSSLDARIALCDLASSLALPQPKTGPDSAESLYAAESALLTSQRVIPLLHLRLSHGIGPRVKNWVETPDGTWQMPGVWLTEKP